MKQPKTYYISAKLLKQFPEAKQVLDKLKAKESMSANKIKDAEGGTIRF